jgi:hypothetical protein
MKNNLVSDDAFNIVKKIKENACCYNHREYEFLSLTMMQGKVFWLSF